MKILRLACSLVVLTLLTIPRPLHAQDGWLLFRSNPQRTSAAGKLPVWEKKTAWQRPLLLDKIEGFDEPLPEKSVKTLLDRLRKDADPVILPAFFPVIAKESCMYRTHGDVRCVPLQPLAV